MKNNVKSTSFAVVLAALVGFLTAPVQAATANNRIAPTGYHGLTFGQKIDKKTLNRAGLAYPKDANRYCYYVPVVNHKIPSPVLIQVVNNRFGLVSVKDNSVSLFSNTRIGDPVAKVLQANKGLPTYQIDKYDTGNGNKYHLIYNLPNQRQVKYTFIGGSPLPSPTVAPQNWQPKLKNRLTGRLQAISVGMPSAIALVEGCS